MNKSKETAAFVPERSIFPSKGFSLIVTAGRPVIPFPLNKN